MRFWLAVCLFISTASFAGSFQLKNFSVGAMRFTPTNWTGSVFPDLAWTPHWDAGSFAVRLGFGASAPKDENNKRYLSTYYQAAVMLPLFSFFAFEASFGYRTFHKDEVGSHPEYGGGLLLRPAEFLDRVYICMSQYLVPNNTTSIFRAGVSLSF
jgi:hypothetical protein